MGFIGSLILFAVIGIFGFLGARFFGFSFRASILFFFGIMAGISFSEGFSFNITENYSWALILGALIDRFVVSKLEESNLKKAEQNKLDKDSKEN